MTDSTRETTSEETRSGWHLNMPINLQDRLPNVGQAMSGFVPQVIGPSNHHRSILNRLNSRERHTQPTHDASVVVNMEDEHDHFMPSHNGTEMNTASQEHFQLPGGPAFQDENQNEEGEGHHHGHTHEGTGSHLNWRSVVMNSGVFIIILCIRLLAQHFLGLLVFLGMFGTFVYSNVSLQKLVHQSSLRDASFCKLVFSYLWIITFLSANIAVIFYVFKDQALWNVLIFQLPANWQSNFWEFLWVVIVTDFILKFSTIILKAVFSLFPFGQKRRGKVYMCIENIMQMYRILTPIIPWFHFLSDGEGWVFAAILLVLYFIFKISQALAKLLEVFKSIRRLNSDINYGTRPSSSEINQCGESCPICQDDYKDPIKLTCKHIFCENCVSMWFDREKTCPMCRAQIHTESPLWKDGSTSVHIQWY